MTVSLNTFAHIAIICVFVGIFSWNLLNYQEGLEGEDDDDEDEDDDDEDDEDAGKDKKKLSKKEKIAKRKREAKKAQDDVVDRT